MGTLRASVCVTVAIGIVAGSTNVYGQSALRVQEGQTLTLTEERMFVDEWVMEDNSTLLIDPAIRTWAINASRARFGDNTTIAALGLAGTNGRSSQAHGGNGGECTDGGHGGDGLPGTSGGAGVNIDITMGLLSVTNLIIHVAGGDGSDGGDGANGGQGGRASCGRVCSGQEGGNGGQGGNAGHGGQGGNVKISYWLAGREPLSVGGRGGAGLRVNAAGGDPGRPGQGGRGARGGAGRSCPFFVKRGAGPWGSNGGEGDMGRPGMEGSVEYLVMPSPQ